MSEQNKIDEIKARATETMVQTRGMHWSLNDVLLNDIFWLIGQIERKDEALKTIADYDAVEHHGYVDEWNEAASFNECKRIAREAL